MPSIRPRGFPKRSPTLAVFAALIGLAFTACGDLDEPSGVTQDDRTSRSADGTWDRKNMEKLGSQLRRVSGLDCLPSTSGSLNCAGVVLRKFESEKAVAASLIAYRKFKKNYPRNVLFGDEGLVVYSMTSPDALTETQKYYFGLVEFAVESVGGNLPTTR